MQIHVAFSICAAMCLPPKPPVVAAAPRTLKRNVPLVKKQIGTMHVTEVCAGTMTWGSFVEKEESAHKELDTFLAAGVNFLDTAEIYPVAFNYGKTTETWIGHWLKKRMFCCSTNPSPDLTAHHRNFSRNFWDS